MGISTALFDAVKALREKIVQAAPTATAEELAYMSSAIEKIAGQASALDLVDYAELLKVALNEYKASCEAELAKTVNTTVVNAETDLGRIKETYIGELANQQQNSQAAMTQLSDASIKKINDTAAPVIAQVDTSISQLKAAVDEALVAAKSIRSVQPITPAKMAFFASF